MLALETTAQVRACLKFPLRVHWLGKWTDAMTQIRSIFRNMLEIENAADGRLPPQGAAGGVSKKALTNIATDQDPVYWHRNVCERCR